jgi:6-phosphogluconolactonase
MSWTQTLHRDANALAAALSEELQRIIADAIATRGSASLALAGGSTPFPIYRRLAAMELAWSRVSLIPTDERWVQAEHPASNLRAMREAFAAAHGVRLLSLTPIEPHNSANATFALNALVELANPFDVALLGMGGDGHFASLFPGASELEAGLHGDAAALVVHPSPLPPEAPFARISLGLERLLNSRRMLLAVTGQTKRAVLDRAQSANDPLALPICAMLHQQRLPLEIHWSP